ncbi:MAG: hypothetical protein ACRD3E_01325 [Terriglobales bacterium]
MFLDQVDGFQPVLALGDDVDIADLLQQEDKLIARQLLVINDNRGKRHSESSRNSYC